MVDKSEWVGCPAVSGNKAWIRLINVTIAMLGIQLVWSTEMAYASPYLISLGLSKTKVAVVFLAGPLSGLIVQPVVGIYSDKCTSSFGRRKPFIVTSCFICTLALLSLGFASDIASLFVVAGSERHQSITIAVACASVYVIDFSVNATMASDRALLVDTLPAAAQDNANAWSARMHGIGSIFGFLVGALDLPAMFPFSTQIKGVCILTALVFNATHTVTCLTVVERVLVKYVPDRLDTDTSDSIFNTLVQIWRSYRTLSQPIWTICQVNSFCAFAWFPVLFYMSTWLGEIYKRTLPEELRSKNLPNDVIDVLAEREGSRAFFYFAVVVFLTSVFLPLLVTTTSRKTNYMRPSSRNENSVFQRIYLQYYAIRPVLTLPQVWTFSNAFFAFLLFCTFIGDYNLTFATIIVALLGICYAVNLWAPFALLGQNILNDNTALKLTSIVRNQHTASNDGNSVIFEAEALIDSDSQAHQDNLESKPAEILHVRHSDSLDLDPEVDVIDSNDHQDESSSDKAGVILGIYNILQVLPHFCMSFMSILLFSVIAPNDSFSTPSEDGTASVKSMRWDATGTVLRIGGISAAFATYLCWKKLYRKKHHDYSAVN